MTSDPSTAFSVSASRQSWLTTAVVDHRVLSSESDATRGETAAVGDLPDNVEFAGASRGVSSRIDFADLARSSQQGEMESLVDEMADVIAADRELSAHEWIFQSDLL